MISSMFRCVASALLVGWSLVAQADGLQALERFLQEVQGAQAQFTQVVTSPRREGEAVARSKTSSGSFEFLRPGRFRFEYTQPFEQTIVADGQTLWLHDVDLNQVTARPQLEALGNTPAALIASGTDLKPLRQAFDLRAVPEQDGQKWVEATPRTRDGPLQRVRVGFRQGQLSALEIVDSLGQRSVLSFSQWQTQVAIKPDRFRFQPPPGADVIRP